MQKKLYTAGEIAELSGVTVRTIRFYDIKGLLKPTKYSEAGYRLYDEKSMERLQKIQMFKFLGFSLEKIQYILNNDLQESCIKENLKKQKQMLIKQKQHLEKVIAAVESAEEAREDNICKQLMEVTKIVSLKELSESQYATDENLKRRVNIHQFSTSKKPWMEWVYDKLLLREGSRVLEFGCGNGILWREMVEVLPENLEITLTDFSEGMLQAAQEGLKPYRTICENKNILFKYELIDADKINRECEIFQEKYDLILANHMLYHVYNRERFLRMIKEILTSDGSFCCTTVGAEHMKELEQLVKKFDKRIECLNPKSIGFNLENGEEQLKKVFSQVKKQEQENDLIVDDTEVLYQYVYSYPGNAPEILGERGEEFRKLLEKQIKKEGAMYIHKSQGLFICKK